MITNIQKPKSWVPDTKGGILTLEDGKEIGKELLIQKNDRISFLL